MKRALRRAVDGAAGVVLHQIALRLLLLSAPRFSFIVSGCFSLPMFVIPSFPLLVQER